MSAQRIPRNWANRRLLRAALLRQQRREYEEFWAAFLAEHPAAESRST